MKVSSILIFVAMIAPAWMSVATAQTLPDTSCASAVGVGAGDIPHVYANGIGLPGVGDAWKTSRFEQPVSGHDLCPTHYSGELGFGIGGAWLFARDGPDANGDGDGVVACYGSTDPTSGPTTGHHGSATTIKALDDVLGGAVSFFVMRDYNRSATNPILPSSNNAGDLDCGDNIVEPCADPSQESAIPGCNPLDASEFMYPATGMCTGLSSLGPFPPAPNPTLVDLVVNFALSLLGLVTGGASCDIPGPTSWTAPGALEEWAGADGAIVLLACPDSRYDQGEGSFATTGAVWTE